MICLNFWATSRSQRRLDDLACKIEKLRAALAALERLRTDLEKEKTDADTRCGPVHETAVRSRNLGYARTSI